MIKSMTAFARVERQTESGELVWEIRSVNHRYLEAFIRQPEEFRALEPKVRELIGQSLKRGKVEANLRFKGVGSKASSIAVNTSLAKELIKALREVSILIPDVKSPTTIDILGWPGVVEPEERDFSPLLEAAMESLKEALHQLVDARQREGDKLSAIILERTSACTSEVEKARKRMPAVLEMLRDRLTEKFEEFKEQLDPGRIEQEMVITVQKLDVDEELDRLGAHISEVEQVMERNEPVGRRLDFLMQEMNREANTLASKSNDQEMTAIAVELKVLIEQMREQIQNIE